MSYKWKYYAGAPFENSPAPEKLPMPPLSLLSEKHQYRLLHIECPKSPFRKSPRGKSSNRSNLSRNIPKGNN